MRKLHVSFYAGCQDLMQNHFCQLRARVPDIHLPSSKTWHWTADFQVGTLLEGRGGNCKRQLGLDVKIVMHAALRSVVTASRPVDGGHKNTGCAMAACGGCGGVKLNLSLFPRAVMSTALFWPHCTYTEVVGFSHHYLVQLRSSIWTSLENDGIFLNIFQLK